MLLSLLHLVMRDAGEPEGLLKLRAAARGEGVVATRHQARQGVHRGHTMLAGWRSLLN